MEIKYLCSKRGSISDTLSWLVATSIIVILLIIYLFVMVFSNSNSTFKPDYKKFLSNSFEREFYTFLEERILFGGKNVSVRELSKLVVLRGDERGIAQDRRTKISKEELALRNFSSNFFMKQSNLRDIEKKGISYEVFITVENFIPPQQINEEETKYSFYLVYDEMLRFFPNNEKELTKIHFDSFGSCNLKDKNTLFREAFISKDKKLVYCFTY